MTEIHVSTIGGGRVAGTATVASAAKSMPTIIRAAARTIESLAVVELDEERALLAIRAGLVLKAGRIKISYTAASAESTIVTAECRIPSGITGTSEERARRRLMELFAVLVQIAAEAS